MRQFVILTAVLVLAPALSTNAQTFSTSITANYEVIPNVTYVELGAWQGQLDLYLRADAQGPHPTLIFFHGGADDRGTKEKELFNLLRYLELGWNVVNVEHRLPGVTLAPAAMQNGWCARRWVMRNSELYGFDRNRVVVSGQSAGGWTALTTGMAPAGYGEQVCPGKEEMKVAAIVNWYGVADPEESLTRQSPGVTASFRGFSNPAEAARAISPVHLVRLSVPPVISIHGEMDGSVAHIQAVRLHDALKKAGVMEQLITIPRGGHGGFSRADNEKAYAAIEQFLGRLGIRPIPVGGQSPSPTTFSVISLDAAVVSRYVGRYRASTGDIITFTRNEGRYYVQQASQQKPIEVFPSSDRTFFLKSGMSSVSFVVDNDGRASGVIVHTNGRYSRWVKID
jgi:acetyl esterase/lipase